jgi:hypothetical protein
MTFGRFRVMVQRSLVSGRVDAVRTEYSKDYVPLDPRLDEWLWRMQGS